MGKVFWNDAVGPPIAGEPDNIGRGYRVLVADLTELEQEVALMLSRVERRIEEREVNTLYDPASDLDSEHQSALDTYYRTHADKLRWIQRGLRGVKERAEIPGRDPAKTSFKVVSIR